MEYSGQYIEITDATQEALDLKADTTYVDSQDALKANLASSNFFVSNYNRFNSNVLVDSANHLQVKNIYGYPNINIAPGASDTDITLSPTGTGKVRSAKNIDLAAGMAYTIDNVPIPTNADMALKADDDVVVKLTSDQTIAGNKTFSNDITCAEVKNTSGHLKLLSSGNDLNLFMGSAETLQLTRKDNSGTIETRYQSNGGTGEHRFMNKVNCNGDMNIASGKNYQINGTNIPTNAEVSAKADDNVVVKLTGDQTIAGNKTFSNDITCAEVKNTSGHLKLLSSGNDLNLFMGSAETLQLTRKDNSGTIETRYQSNGGTGEHRFMNKVSCNEDVNIATGKNYKINGTNIPTNAEVNAKANDNVVVKTTGDQTIAGEKTFSSDIICAEVKNTSGHLKLLSSGNDLNIFMGSAETLQLTRKDNSGTIETRYQCNGGTGEHRFMNKVNINAGGLNILSLPTSASGLAAGDIYSDGGTLKIVS